MISHSFNILQIYPDNIVNIINQIINELHLNVNNLCKTFEKLNNIMSATLQLSDFCLIGHC